MQQEINAEAGIEATRHGLRRVTAGSTGSRRRLNRPETERQVSLLDELPKPVLPIGSVPQQKKPTGHHHNCKLAQSDPPKEKGYTRLRCKLQPANVALVATSRSIFSGYLNSITFEG